MASTPSENHRSQPGRPSTQFDTAFSLPVWPSSVSRCSALFGPSPAATRSTIDALSSARTKLALASNPASAEQVTNPASSRATLSSETMSDDKSTASAYSPTVATPSALARAGDLRKLEQASTEGPPERPASPASRAVLESRLRGSRTATWRQGRASRRFRPATIRRGCLRPRILDHAPEC